MAFRQGKDAIQKAFDELGVLAEYLFKDDIASDIQQPDWPLDLTWDFFRSFLRHALLLKLF
jgi:hypothetical protein